MPKKTQLKLDDLRVASFVTDLKKKEQEKAKAGHRTVIEETFLPCTAYCWAPTRNYDCIFTYFNTCSPQFCP